MQLIDGLQFGTEAEAQHGVFLLRVNDLRGREDEHPLTPLAPSLPAVYGYCDHMSAEPGDRIAFFVNSEGCRSVTGRLVRHHGPGEREPVAPEQIFKLQARSQNTRAGSYVEVDDQGRLLTASSGLAVHTFIAPTALGRGRQAILARSGDDGYIFGLGAGGELTLWLARTGQHSLEWSLPVPVEEGSWAAVGFDYQPATDRVTLYHRPLTTAVNGTQSPLTAASDLHHEVFRASTSSETASSVSGLGNESGGSTIEPPFAIAAVVGFTQLGERFTAHHFNGKIERPRVYGRTLDLQAFERLTNGEPDDEDLIAAWHFEDQITFDGVRAEEILDRSANGLHGIVINNPARAVTGPHWRGSTFDYRYAPIEYGAIWFHEDDLADAAWHSDLSATLPIDLESGLYGLEVTTDDGHAQDDIPFVVRPRRRGKTSDVAVLLPTATYLAYANQVPILDPTGEALGGQTPILDNTDLTLLAHPEFAYSTYNRHADESGIMFSSRLRPTLTTRIAPRPGSSRWGLAADICLLGWLRSIQCEVDIFTDEDLDQRGIELLDQYRVVLTGTHPEYVSGAMLDALEGFVAHGGRLMYVGGNGFYWVISFDPARPHILEVRKQGGTRAWDAGPGEHHHSTTGELGGIWKRRGRPPQKLVGVGFSAQGFDQSSYFQRLPDSRLSETAFIFDGVTGDPRFGEHGLVGGGAAGLELDRYDPNLGSPPNAFIVATSLGHTDTYTRVVEEVTVMRPGLSGSQDSDVRADIVYFRTDGGGAVFSTGSIAWCTSLPTDGYDNDVARITHNVLNAFLGDALPHQP